MREFKVKKTRNENLYHQSRVTRRGDISTSPRRDILQRFQKRCRMSSPRQKYAFAAATYHAAARYKSRRGRSPAPRREQVVAAAKNLPRAPCSRHIVSPRHHTFYAAANVFLAAATILFRRGEDSTTLV